MNRVATTFAAAILTLCALPLVAQDKPPTIKLERMARNLKMLTDLTDDGSGRLFVTEKEGRVRLLTGHGADVAPTPFLDISDHVYCNGECGLLSVRFHPKFATNGLLYVDYTTGKPKSKNSSDPNTLKTIIAEFKADPKSETVDPKSERILLTQDQPYPNHNGGQLQFGPDGYLYIAFGDGGSHDDPHNNGQSLNTLLGKILRIDVNSRTGDLAYAIPADNPFAGKPDARGEIYAWGLRNPWRFTFDRQTHTLFAGDVGQNMWEEVDVIVKGGNYGWRAREGLHENPNIKHQDPASQTIDPIAEYPHKPAYPHAIYGKDVADLSVTGGYVYRGTKYPALVGWYLFADYASGRIWGLKYEDGKVAAKSLLLESKVGISSFGEDKDGDLYVCDHKEPGGSVYHIAAE